MILVICLPMCKRIVWPTFSVIVLHVNWVPFSADRFIRTFSAHITYPVYFIGTLFINAEGKWKCAWEESDRNRCSRDHGAGTHDRCNWRNWIYERRRRYKRNVTSSRDNRGVSSTALENTYPSFSSVIASDRTSRVSNSNVSSRH